MLLAAVTTYEYFSYICKVKWKSSDMTQREDKQRARTSREELGKYFYNLSAMSFGTTVLGSGMALVTESGNPQKLISFLVVGIVLTVFLAGVAFKIINGK